MSFKLSLATLGFALALTGAGAAETVTHAQGETVIDVAPQRVAVFDTASLDTLLALGVPVAGVTSGVMPEYLASRIDPETPRIGTLFEPDYEAVNALAPDLIIVGGRSAAKYPELAGMAPTIDMTVTRGDYLASARANVETLGRIFDKEAEAAALLADYDAEVTALRELAPDAGRVLVILTTGGRMSAHGAGSRFGVLHDDYGLAPAADGLDTGTHGQAISHEFILETDPDWLFVVDRDAAIGREGQSARQLLDNELVQRSKAWKAGHVVYLDPALWYLVGGGITALTDAARQIRTALAEG